MSKNQNQTTGKTVKQVKEFNGLLTCILEHEVTKTTAAYEWTGPKISRECWNEVLAFFRWTYDTTKSESQVRLYVNHLTHEWKAWAYPQRGGTGMTSNEIDVPWGPEQFCFNPAEGWCPYGTVHHHCSSSAFQSGTDERDESTGSGNSQRGQDGIHITVGHLDKDQYDIHFRIYQSSYKLVSVGLDEFWDVGDPFVGVPSHVKALLPDDAKKKFAAIQMGTPPPVDYPFPEVWKENLVRVVSQLVTHVHTQWQGPTGNFHGSGSYYRRSYADRSLPDLEWDGSRAVEELGKFLDSQKPAGRMTIKQVIAIMEFVVQELDLDILNVIDILTHNDVSAAYFLERLLKLEEKLLEEELTKKHGKLLGNGSPSRRDQEELQKELMDQEGGGYGHDGSGYSIGY